MRPILATLSGQSLGRAGVDGIFLLVRLEGFQGRGKFALFSLPSHALAERERLMKKAFQPEDGKCTTVLCDEPHLL